MDAQKTISILVSIACLVVAVMIHEVAHGLAALWCGDPTARDAKRLSLNPLRHIDPVGSIIIPLVLAVTNAGVMFGWAKPVPVNLGRTRDPKNALWITALAGPASNLLQALIGALLYHGVSLAYHYLPVPELAIRPLAYVQFTAYIYIGINIILMLFNMLPIPPLDGSRVVAAFLPTSLAQPYLQLGRFGFFIIFLILYIDLDGDILLNGLRNAFALLGLH